MNAYAHWTPMTDTRELPAHRRGLPRGSTAPIVVIEGEVDDATREVGFPWSQPHVTRYRHVPGWLRLARRVRRSRFAADVRARWQTVLAFVGLAGVVLLLLSLQDAVHALAPIAGIAQ